MLKKLVLSFLVIFQLIVPFSAIAGIKGTAQSVGYNSNPTYIRNKTNDNLAYEIHGSTVWNSVYGVRKNYFDKYHAGEGDGLAYIEVGICSDFEFPDKCHQHTQLKSCVDSFYDINQVSDIIIKPGLYCEVKCRDGSSTSCIR